MRNFHEFHRGAMRQKIAIFKRGNSVCRGTIFFEWRKFHEFHRGAMRQKMAIFKGGNSVCRVQTFLNGEIFMNLMKRNLLHMATFHEFDLIGERCEKNDDFQKEKQHIEGYTRFVMGAMFMKIIILLKKKSHMSKYYLMIIFCSIKFSRTKLVPYL